jgi:hypothetical protein
MRLPTGSKPCSLRANRRTQTSARSSKTLEKTQRFPPRRPSGPAFVSHIRPASPMTCPMIQTAPPEAGGLQEDDPQSQIWSYAMKVCSEEPSENKSTTTYAGGHSM